MSKPSVDISQQKIFNVENISARHKLKDGKKEDCIFDITDALRSPILTFSHQWANLIPSRLLNQVTISRMVALLKEECLATYPESCIYLYTASFEGPLDADWTNIYTHVSCKSLQDWFNEDHWNSVKGPRVLNEWLASKLNKLRRHIYQKRREILNQRIKAEEKLTKELQTNSVKNPPAIMPTIIQTSFNF